MPVDEDPATFVHLKEVSEEQEREFEDAYNEGDEARWRETIPVCGTISGRRRK